MYISNRQNYFKYLFFFRGEHGDEDGSDNASLTPGDERIFKNIATLLAVDYDQLVQVKISRWMIAILTDR